MAKVAVHSADCDGILSASLILLKYPEAEIDFLTVEEAKETNKEYDIAVDLPRPRKCRLWIDHHESNSDLKRNGDYFDPNANSAASLLVKALDLERSKIAREIVEMANLADTGRHTDDLLILDRVIKWNQGNKEKLLAIARAVSKSGRDFMREELISSEWRKIKPEIERFNKKIEEIISRVTEGARVALIDERGSLPYIVSKDLGVRLLDKFVVVALVYEVKDGLRISFRSKNENVEEIAKKLGGGGHVHASGSSITEGELYKVVEEISRRWGPVVYFRVR